eukprot:1762008-Rhodomonas_salina.1
MRGSIQTERTMVKPFLNGTNVHEIFRGYPPLVVSLESCRKQFYELCTATKFDETLLLECFVSVATDKNLCFAQFEWLDDERLLVKCSHSIRQNTLVKALQTPEASSI